MATFAPMVAGLSWKPRKATQEFPALAAGVLHITVGEGKPVAIVAVVGKIDVDAAARRQG